MKRFKGILLLVLMVVISLGMFVVYSNVSADKGATDEGEYKDFVKMYVYYVIDGKYK